MYLGRYPLGVELPIRVICRNADEVAVNPDSAPQLELRNASGTIVIPGLELFPLDRRDVTGAFWLPLFLRGIVVGQYTAIVRWQAAGFDGVAVKTFDVIPGGDEGGAVIALHYFDRPTGKFIVYSTDGGNLYKGKNPK